MNGVEEICRLAEEAYDKGLVKPAPHNLFAQGKACAVGAAAVQRLVSKGVSMGDVDVYATVHEVDALMRDVMLQSNYDFAFGFDDGIQNKNSKNWSSEYIDGHKFGDKIRQKFLFPEVPESV